MRHFFIFVRYPEFRKKALTLSYDDGVTQDIRLMEILDRYGLKCTFNLNSCFLQSDDEDYAGRRHLTRTEALNLYGPSKHEVALHTHTHPFLDILPKGNAAWEITENRQILEKLFGRIITGMAYPMGTYNDAVLNTLSDCGVSYARTVESTHSFDLPKEWLRLHPTCHHKDEMLPLLCEEFLSMKVKHMSQMFYLWGHSYEFDDSNNWNIIEDFCEKMSGHNEIWYATNGEICDYIMASQEIRSSADGRTLYNPTCTPIYLEADNKEILLRPGEKIEV